MWFSLLLTSLFPIRKLHAIKDSIDTNGITNAIQDPAGIFLPYRQFRSGATVQVFVQQYM